MTDWAKVLTEHLNDMLAWARGGAISPIHDPESCIADAFDELYLRDPDVENPVGLWKVAARRKAVASYRRRGVHQRFLAQAPALVAEGDTLLVSLDRCRPTRHGPTGGVPGVCNNKEGYGVGYVLPELPCPVCDTPFKPRMNSRGKRTQTCSLVCGSKLRWDRELANAPDTCGREGHRPYTDRADGRRRCMDCANERERARRERLKEAA